MDPRLFKVTEQENASFHIQDNKDQVQYNQIHYHPEYQISLIVKGQGISSIGNCLEPFSPGDLFFIGPNVPHVFKNDFREEASINTKSHIISIFFKDASFGHNFFSLPELAALKNFLATSSRGLKLSNNFTTESFQSIFDLNRSSGTHRLIKLLDLLNNLSLNKNWRYLSSIGYAYPYKKEFYSSMNRIFKYISENFDRPIALEDAAGVANLSKYAFCRYFKKMTAKSFITYLNEYRVGVGL